MIQSWRKKIQGIYFQFPIYFLCRFIQWRHCFGHKAKQESLYLYDRHESLSAGIMRSCWFIILCYLHIVFFSDLFFRQALSLCAGSGRRGGESSVAWHLGTKRQNKHGHYMGIRRSMNTGTHIVFTPIRLVGGPICGPVGRPKTIPHIILSPPPAVVFCPSPFHWGCRCLPDAVRRVGLTTGPTEMVRRYAATVRLLNTVVRKLFCTKDPWMDTSKTKEPNLTSNKIKNYPWLK